ncbi:probable GPI-anchored adhesin-like protein PGA55 [Drosophila serrata]|uniref:probable GPI-anchored adhesin-like protein PGA55 n=1 Tax=Drosophila serrata TaxID=7274 RepID=UPI000A1D047E|nr:probable GPI-anchored adhesin-like protein PGA55 [Drosophila serrata]
MVHVIPTEILSTQSESKLIPSDKSSHIIINQKNGGATTVFLDDDPFTNFVELKTDQISNASVEITKTEEMLETIITTVLENSIIDSSVIKSSQDDLNEPSCDHNHLTSQVFLTQIPKSLSIQVSNDSNPFLAFNVVETTKYYCIQAAEEVVNNTIMASVDTSIQSMHEELMPTELIDDLDETTAKNVEDYDVTTETEEDDDYDGNNEEIDLIYKTLYTTYTYLTTFFEGSQTTVSSHTEIITNIISSTLDVGKTKLVSIKNTLEEQDINSSSISTKYTIPLDIVNVLSSETGMSLESITDIDLDDNIYTKTLLTTYTYYTSIFTNNDTEITSRTEVITNFLTDSNTLSSIEKNSTYENSQVNLVEHTSENHKELSRVIQKTPLDDQVSSESNDHDEIMPSATLLLQTSFTTFTFYTTMYVGDDTNIISRLETVTNVATETLKPTKHLSVEDASFPITYFTTYTYWTKLAKDGEITTLSREETLYNVIQPKNNGTEISYPYKATNETTEAVSNVIHTSSSSTDITTYYTTYTYYTTSYEANSTIIASNLETVTNVVTSYLSTPSDIEPSISVTSTEQQIIPITKNPNVILYDYKHIIDADEVSTLYFTTEVVSSMNLDGSNIEVTSSTSRLHVDEAKKSNLSTQDDEIYSSSTSKMYKTGLVRLIEGKRIQNNTTTLYQSKVIGTIIDNRYAQIIESTSSFLYEKAKTDELVIATSVEESSIEPETQKVELTKSLIGNKENIADIEDDEVTRGDVPQRPFAPVIRPFASRNRPSYAPKQKTLSPSSATIITRSDITPTITATPALKSSSGGRYISSRRGIISSAPINPSESNLSQSSRRLFGRPSKSLSNSIDQSGSQASFQPSRNRFVSSSRSNPIATSSRRPNISFRPSIAPGFRASGIINNPKLRVRPTSLGSTLSINAQSKAVSSSSQISNEDEGNLTEEISGEDEEEKQTRSNQNPLLRFRRPINKPSGFSPTTRQNSGVSPGVSLRKNPLLSLRSKPSPATSPTTSTTTPKPKSFTFQRPSGLQNRSRPQNSLFPPRGLFQSQKEIDPLESNTNEGLTGIDSEYDDSSEDDEDGNQQTFQNQKRSTKLRVRRQVDPLSRSRFRFRRQNVTAISPNQKVEEALDDSTLNPRGRLVLDLVLDFTRQKQQQQL